VGKDIREERLRVGLCSKAISLQQFVKGPSMCISGHECKALVNVYG